jgi:acyl-CoA thioester hydrolase
VVTFVVEVPVRWSDVDMYGHVNHARTVTLLEEARTELLFNEMPRRGHGRMPDGMVVYRLSVDYLAPVLHGAGPVAIEMWTSDVRAASFVLHYTMRAPGGDKRLVVARTTMVPYELATSRPRRLAANEEAFLAELAGPADVPARGASGRSAAGG